jgi:ElaB/YqjD/DUF883 family membrane-anchored ribosome-binding protein
MGPCAHDHRPTSLCWRGVSETPEQREPEQGPEDEPTTADELAAGPPTEAMEPPVADEPASEPLPPEPEPRAPNPVPDRLTPDPETWSSALARGPADPPPKVRAEFPIVFRGYDREVVDAHLAAVEEDVIELHSTRSPQAAVRRELDRVGKETAAILQRAHEAADEIAARSRARADARVEEAEREAERIRRDAEQRTRQLDKDVDEIWAERRKLIEDARAVGEALIRMADEALDRFPPDEDGGPPAEAAEPIPAPAPPTRGPAPEPEPEPEPPPRLLEEVPPPDNEEPPVGDPAIESVRRIPRPGAPRHPRRPQSR